MKPKTFARSAASITLILAGLCGGWALASGAKPVKASPPSSSPAPLLLPRGERYLAVVLRSLDAILDNARDTTGPLHTGMIMSVLDRKTGRPLAKLPKAPTGIRASDRTEAYGSNANLQQDLYRALQHASRITGDPRYETAARAALLDFLRLTQNKETGLLAWGEHLDWNCVLDAPGTKDNPQSLIHEPKRKLLFFDLWYAAEPARTIDYARGLWEHQIADHKTGDFSRHAGYDRHKPGKGYDFPKEGGYFIDIWARAYEKTQDPVFATAIRVLARRYLARMNGRDLLDDDSTKKDDRVNICLPLWMPSLAMEASEAAGRVDAETARTLRELAARQDRGFLGLAHEPDDPAKGFIYCAFTDSGQPRPRYGTDGHSKAWEMGYGVNLTMMFGLLSYTRQAQLGSGAAAEAYRRLTLRAADLYRKVPAQPAKADIWAGEYGMAIFLELAAHRLTHDRAYLDAACALADEAIKVLWDKNYPLPRASSKTGHYEAISYPDTLILALLALHEHVAGLDPRVPISDLNR